MLGSCEVLVWFARPDALDDLERRQAALALLTADERERVSRFHFERDRTLHLAARALVRLALSRCADVAPGAWRFEVRPGGRPEIATPPSPLRFNVSHTHGLAMVAVTAGRDVGADVERLPPAVPLDVVERSFAPSERAAVRAAGAGEERATFASLWTMKEAYAKARGLGLALPFDAFAVGLAPPRLVSGDDPSAWRVELLAPTPAHRAAVCVGRGAEDPPLRVTSRWDEGSFLTARMMASAPPGSP